MNPDYDKDGFVAEQPPSISHRFTAQLGPKSLGHFQTREEAEDALPADLEAAWFIPASGDDLVWIPHKEDA